MAFVELATNRGRPTMDFKGLRVYSNGLKFTRLMDVPTDRSVKARIYVDRDEKSVAVRIISRDSSDAAAARSVGVFGGVTVNGIATQVPKGDYLYSGEQDGMMVFRFRQE